MIVSHCDPGCDVGHWSAVPSLFDVLEVYQYLLSPKSDDE